MAYSSFQKWFDINDDEELYGGCPYFWIIPIVFMYWFLGWAKSRGLIWKLIALSSVPLCSIVGVVLMLPMIALWAAFVCVSLIVSGCYDGVTHGCSKIRDYLKES